MKKNIILLSLLLAAASFQAQNVGVGTNTPAASAKLDVTSTNSGVLIPRVALTMTTAAGPVAAPANSLLVYNTATVADVTPGFYYWSSTTSSWIRLAEGSGWLTAGNTGIGAANFLGPINAADLNFRTNNTQRAVITSTGIMGINVAAPNNSAQLDVTATNRGLLIPRVALTMTTAAGPITTPATSLMVYNTATVADVTPGFYYWDGTKWVRFNDKTNWTIFGNAGTNDPAVPGTYGTSLIAGTENWVGTTDAQDFVIGTNNIERLRVKQTNGRVGIGTANPILMLEVNSAAGDAIFGHSTNVGGYLGYETNFVVGTAGTIQGAGVWAANPTAGYTSSYAQSSGAATVAANINFSSVWIASYNLVDNASATFNPSAIYAQVNNTSTTMGAGAFKNAIYAYSNRGTTAGNPGYTVGINGLANSQNEDAIGVVGRSFCSSGFTLGGYFEGNNYAGTNIAYAYVGGNDGFGATKITGTGSVAEIIPTENHGRISLMCPESPEYWYQDYGSVELVNGKAHVDLDPILADIVFIDEQNPIRVFCTPVNMLYFNGVTIVNQTPTGFDLVELNGGTNSGKLHYQIILKPKTNYGEGRFPQAPGPLYVKKDKEPASAKAKNQPDMSKMFFWPADYEVYGYDPEEMVGIGEVIPAGPNAGKIKLGNGKYADNVPLKNTDLNPK